MKSYPSRVFRVAAALFAICLVGAALPARADEDFKKPEFTITLPDGWVEMSKAEIDAFNANIRKHPAGKTVAQFRYGFHPKASGTPSDYPYIVARVTTGGRIPEASLRKLQTVDLNKALKREKHKLPAFVSRALLGHPLYDPALHTIWVTAQMNVKGQGEVQGLTAIIATRNGFLQVSGWATRETFASYLPAFHQVMATVVLPPSMHY
jgi:hypothetical protein